LLFLTDINLMASDKYNEPLASFCDMFGSKTAIRGTWND